MISKIPSYESLMIAVFEGLQNLGGTASNSEIRNYIINSLKLPTNYEDIKLRVTWSQTYLKKCNILNNPKRGIWTINSDYLYCNPDKISGFISLEKALKQ